MKSNLLFDTNVVIDYLNAIPYAKTCLEQCINPSLSVVSVIEILCGVPKLQEKEVYRWLKSDFSILEIDERITLEAVNIRRSKKLKLPDTLILATAIAHGLILHTRDIKGFAGYGNVVLVKNR